MIEFFNACVIFVIIILMLFSIFMVCLCLRAIFAPRFVLPLGPMCPIHPHVELVVTFDNKCHKTVREDGSVTMYAREVCRLCEELK